MTDMLKAAQWYAGRGFSVIPVSPANKKSLVKWAKYQKEMPTEAEITEWWTKNPKANIGIVTGEISGITVIDLDSQDAIDKIEEHLPDGFLTPIAKSPRGGRHLYFAYTPEIQTVAGRLPATDIRNNGAYIIAPPSSNGRGAYEWFKGLSIIDVGFNNIPDSIVVSLYRKNIYRVTPPHNADNDVTLSRHSLTLSDTHIQNGTRDEALFHLANHLIKGGMQTGEVSQYLTLMALNCCETPFPVSEIPIKIKSVLDRTERQTRGWSEEVRNVVVTLSGTVTTLFVQNRLSVTLRQDKKQVNNAMLKLEKDGLIKRTGRIAGEYHIVSQSCTKRDWKNAKREKLDLVLPLGMDECIQVMPGSILCFSGHSNSGKTALAMDFAINNAERKINYFSSETHETEFKERAELRSPLDEWKNVDFYDGWESREIQDIIIPGQINIIDYLEPPDGDYTQMSPKLTEIHKVIEDGIAFVCIQKRGEGLGVGGLGMIEKPQLFCTLEILDDTTLSSSAQRLTIVKCKIKKREYKNPYKKFVDFTVNHANGCELLNISYFNFEKYRR